MVGAVGLARTIPAMLRFTSPVPWAVTFTKLTFVQDVSIVKFPAGSVVFTKTHGPHVPPLLAMAVVGSPPPLVRVPLSRLQPWYSGPVPLTTVPCPVAFRHIQPWLVQLLSTTVMYALGAMVSEPWKRTHVSFPGDTFMFDAHKAQHVEPIDK